MKKVLTVLCFALCASLAFAQTNTMISSKVKGATPAAQMSKVEMVTDAQAGYIGSLFTKDDADPLYTNTFAQEPTTGTLSASDRIDNATVGNDAHDQGFHGSKWHRIGDTSRATSEAQAENYPVFYGDAPFRFNFPSATPDNGFMLMSMEDQVAGWGGSGSTGNFNAYFAMPAVATTGHSAACVRLYQFYRCFNNDKCYIDYSTDGTNWKAIEFNVARVDVDVNGSLRGNYTIYLPSETGNQAALHLRVRWACNSGQGGAYGYFWAVDDFRVYPVVDNDLQANDFQFFEGFYGIVPQGLELPAVWNAMYRNVGVNPQTGISASVNHLPTWNSANNTPLFNVEGANIDYTVYDTITVDPLGWYDSRVLYDGTNVAQGPYVVVPTQQEGINYVWSEVHSANGQSLTSDTIGYHVNGFDGNTDNFQLSVQFQDADCAVWGRDNGVLVPNNAHIAGFVDEKVFSTSRDDETLAWTAAGYTQCNTFVTGRTVPEGWRIKGVQIIACATDEETSRDDFFTQRDAKILPVLFKDIPAEEAGSYYIRTLTTGADVHQVTADEVYSFDDAARFAYYALEDGYYAINIEFPTQPELEPMSSYQIGYEIAEECYFAPATGNVIGYYDEEGAVRYFYREADSTNDLGERNMLKSYGTTFGAPNYWNVYIYDPNNFVYNGKNTWSHFMTGNVPMIRMIVGPYEEKPMTDVSFECGDNGEITDLNDAEEYCGETVPFITNARYSIKFVPNDDYVVDQIFVDGEAVFTNDTINVEEYYAGYLTETFVIGEEPMTIRATFMPKPTTLGIDPVAQGVSMNLQPNPATSSTQLTIAGVEGMVELSIIDMSGRVISSNKVNAEQAQSINLSNLAKGAYFVRVTNSDFTKVEKLIVR